MPSTTPPAYADHADQRDTAASAQPGSTTRPDWHDETLLRNRFKPWRVVVPVLLISLAISAWSSWYGRQVSIPRYCVDTVQTVHILERVLLEPDPAGEESRRPYIIAAKLLFLLPRNQDEPVAEYLRRVRAELESRCR